MALTPPPQCALCLPVPGTTRAYGRTGGMPARLNMGWGRTLGWIGIAVAMTATPVTAEDLTRYRGHVLGSSVEDVLRLTNAQASEVITVHGAPHQVQSLEWRTPYTARDAEAGDAAKALTFGFVDGQLYELVVDYDRTRIDELTSADLIAGVAAVYGAPAAKKPKDSASLASGTVLLARWDDGTASLLLVRGPYDDVRLIVRSVELQTRAKGAIAAAEAREIAEAPAKQQEARETANAAAKAVRTRNKAGFRP